MNLHLTLTAKQKLFLDAGEDEVLFGGAAGGGKSYGQLADALLFALRYPGSKQLILRRTFAELDKSLIRQSLSLFPRKIYTFNASSHSGKFINGSCIDFGYCAAETDVYQYQSAEYDVIRFDELTHFTESQYVYLLSRVRGTNAYPKQIKSSTNPGGIGHTWVKRRFVDPAPAGTAFVTEDGLRRIFLPSLVCMAVTVSVAVRLKDGMTAQVIAEGILRLSALLSVGIKGYLQGYAYVRDSLTGWLTTKAKLLEAFLGEKAPEDTAV